MKQKIYYATTNCGKFEEVHEFLNKNAPDLELEMLALDIQEIQSDDQLEIAIDKAQKAWHTVQKPMLLDDAAIYFNQYNKFPGTLSKYVSHGLGLQGLMRLFDEGDKAYFLLQMVYITGPGEYHAFEGRCDGHLVKPEVSDAHPQLPYDAYFVPAGQNITYAKLRGTPEASKYLYRLKALKKFLEWYKQNI